MILFFVIKSNSCGKQRVGQGNGFDRLQNNSGVTEKQTEKVFLKRIPFCLLYHKSVMAARTCRRKQNQAKLPIVTVTMVCSYTGG